MSSSWPVGVTTAKDMRCYANTLFGVCEIEDLLTGTPFDRNPGCHLIRVKGACNQGDWNTWPDLTEKAMQSTVDMYERPDIIQVKARAGRAARARQYDTMQITPNKCTCRINFGGDKHHIAQTSASMFPATQDMAKMLMKNFEPRTEDWKNEHEPGYHTKAFHLVLNKFLMNDGIDIEAAFKEATNDLETKQTHFPVSYTHLTLPTSDLV